MATKIPEELFKLKMATDINLTSNDVYISDSITTKVNTHNLDKKFHIGNKLEKQVLEETVKSIGKNLNWLYNDHGAHNVAAWTGVEMDDSGSKVQRLNWAGQGLNGVVPPEIAKLKALKGLDLRFNAVKFGDNGVINGMIDASSRGMGEDLIR